MNFFTKGAVRERKATNWNKSVTKQNVEKREKIYNLNRKMHHAGCKKVMRNMTEREVLLMDHTVFFEDRDTDLMIHADIFQKTESSQIYPVHIYIRNGIHIGSVFWHRNSGIKLIYSRNKNMTVTVDGNRTCLCPGEFILISNNALYSIIPETDDVTQDVMIISFQPDYLRGMYSCSWDCEVSGDAPGAAKDTKAWMATLCRQLREYVEEYSENEIRHFEINQLLFAILQTIFYEFLVGKQKTSGKQYEMQNKMARVLDYLQEHYRENLTTQFVADYFWYTREYFCRLFKRYAKSIFNGKKCLKITKS